MASENSASMDARDILPRMGQDIANTATSERSGLGTAEQLLPLVYDELRRLAAQKLALERPGQTLQTTALVHEAYLRLVGDGETNGQKLWDHRGHFFAAAAEAMRRILVEAARRKQAIKHGGGVLRVEAEPPAREPLSSPIDIVALDDALARLAERDPQKAQLVKLRYFAGMTMSEAAEALGISVATAERHWTYARTWLFAELGG
jgi:RNA polymerase sigma factor (TIGR02999 family)